MGELIEWTNVIKSHTEITFFGIDYDNNIYYSSEVNFDLDSEVDPFSDYYIDFVAEISNDPKDEGFTDKFGDLKSNRMQIVAPVYASDPRVIATIYTIGRTVAHELGHSFGLRHQYPLDISNKYIKIDAYNLMYQGGSRGSELILPQFQYMLYTAVKNMAK